MYGFKEIIKMGNILLDSADLFAAFAVLASR